jgi:hypothetical protein
MTDATKKAEELLERVISREPACPCAAPDGDVHERGCPWWAWINDATDAEQVLQDAAPAALRVAITMAKALTMADAKLGGAGQDGSCGFHEDIPERQAIDKALAEWEGLLP